MRGLLLAALSVIAFALSPAYAADDFKSLLGTWQCVTEEGTATLVFNSETSLNYNGEELACQLTPGVIRVEDEFLGYVDYPFILKDGDLSITYPEGYTLTFKKAVVKEKTTSAPKTPATGSSALVQHFAGAWKNYTQYTENLVVLNPDGTYGQRYTSSYGSEESGYAAGESHAQGRWTVRGTKEKGMISFVGNDGTSSDYEYQVHVENGEVYWSEYYFNGDLYGKVRE